MSTTPTLPGLTSPPIGRPTADGALTTEMLERLASSFEGNPSYRLAQNAVTQTAVGDVALNRAVIAGTDHTFSHLLDDWTVTNQKKSGRCWMNPGGRRKRRNI